MKKKIIALIITSMSLLSVVIAGLFSFSLNNQLSADSEYTLRFDYDNNFDFDKETIGNFESFSAKTVRGTDIGFYQQNLYKDFYNWRYCSGSGGLLNTTKIGGLKDITISFSDYDHEDSVVKVKYGFEVGSSSTGSYASSPLTKESSLVSETSFNFNNENPSYFYLYFEDAEIEEIVIHFTCVETIPTPAHYELVHSIDEINDEDVYTITNTYEGNGYALSNEAYNEVYDYDNNRYAYSISVSDCQFLDDENILKLKIIYDEGDYYFQTQNYLGVYEEGYFMTGENKTNQCFIASEFEKTAFDISFSEYEELEITHSYYYGYKNYTKRFLFYSASYTPIFTFYTSSTGRQSVFLFKLVGGSSGGGGGGSSEKTISLSYSQLSSMSKSYSTGNYGNLTSGANTYYYYRTVRADSSYYDYAFTMLNADYYYADHGLSAAFFNAPNSPIYGISKIAVTYKATSGLKIAYSKDVGEEAYGTLPASNSYTTNYLEVDAMNFFKVMSNGSNAYINNITITYSGVYTSYNTYDTYLGNRKVVSSYSGSLVDGVSSMKLYVSPTETKTYTYYSKEYAYDNYDYLDLDEVFYIDPVDICNYYLAFHEFPANFITSSEKSSYGYRFGSYARQVSSYTKTTGYATAVPYNCKPGYSYPIYYELDIDLDGSYSTSSRGVGRVVLWEYGFSCYSDSLPVCVFTDDHYASFAEYNNMGGFAHRFDAEGRISGKSYTALSNI